MTAAVGKRNPYLVELVCPEKLPTSKPPTCDLDIIGSFIEFAEACLDGFRSITLHDVSHKYYMLFLERGILHPETEMFSKACINKQPIDLFIRPT